MIGLAFETHTELLKPIVSPEQSAEDNDGRTQVGHVGADTPHHSFCSVDRNLSRLILRKDPVSLRHKVMHQLLGHCLFRVVEGNFRLLLHVLDERHRDAHLVLLHGAPDGGEPLIEAGQRIDTEQAEQTREPPGVIDIRKPETEKPPVGALPVLLNIDLGPFTLLDHRPDRRGDRNKQKQEDCELDGSKEFNEFARELIPAETGSRRTD